MKTFLEHVAEHLLSQYGTDLSHIVVVFPNKRASLFLNEHLARLAGKPLWSPAYMTISELFRSHSHLRVADPIKLVCDLHQCFTTVTGTDETLDHFYGWGQLLLSDFDDIDKNMAPAARVFANLRDIHELDGADYLSDSQKETLRRFFSNFSDDHDTELKRRFLRLWSHMGDVYDTFNRCLAEQGLAYEGALYRQVATADRLEPVYDCYLFVGFNLLHQVEQTLFRRLLQMGKARFYWDFDHYYLDRHEAGHYIAQYLQAFPNELDNHDEAIYGNFSRPKQITYISAATEDIQARYTSQWLTPTRIADGRHTAVVLCNEALLQTVVNSLPEQVASLNVTTGYPLSQTPVATLVSQLVTMQISGRSVKTGYYRLRQVNTVLRHPYAASISPLAQELLNDLNTRKVYYPDLDTLARDEGLTLLFSPLSEPLTASILQWLTALVSRIALNGVEGDLARESLFRMYTLLNRLSGLVDSGDLRVDLITLQRLIQQLVAATTIPFHGEPAEGIQVMGVLETRNLDFDHVLMLSTGEGYMPRGVSDTSFIPYAIRKAYGLTTVDHKVAIYAYYFHRLLQRASDVTMVYTDATNDGQTGEPSRFMLQLMVESPHTVVRHSLRAGQQPSFRQPVPISKGARVTVRLRQRFDATHGGISPTALSTYLRCQLRFFYHYVADLQEPDETDDDTIDNRIFGTIFHQAAQTLYDSFAVEGCTVSARAIDDILSSPVDIQRAVDQAIKRELFHIREQERPLPPLDGLQLINREVIIRYLRQLLEIDRRLAPFTILGLEKTVAIPYGDTTLGGIIDRLDLVTHPETGQQTIRVIDYKTGSRRLKPIADVDAIFDPQNIREHSDYYLQAFLYSHIVSLSTDKPVSPALLFIQHAGVDNYDPTLCLSTGPVHDIATVSEPFFNRLDQLIRNVFDPAVSFTQTEDRTRCASCPYKALCWG